MIRHITFATDNMLISADVCCKSALKHGCGDSKCFTPDLIDSNFWAFNSDIFTQDRGYGYWLWKPYFIYLNLLQMKDGDYLVYTDAGVEFVNDIRKVINVMDRDIFLFGNMYQHDHWCKGSVNVLVCGKYEIGVKQVQASAIIFRASNYSRNAVKCWLLFSQFPNAINDAPSVINHAEFREHRHDQAILTCVAHQLGEPLHWWPATYNDGQFDYPKDGYSDNYPVIFHHHRRRNDEW